MTHPYRRFYKKAKSQPEPTNHEKAAARRKLEAMQEEKDLADLLGMQVSELRKHLEK